MKLVPIPPNTIRQSGRMDKNHNVWWRVTKDKLPPVAILARSTGRGAIKKDVNVYLIAGHNRDVFPDGADKFTIHEYVGLVDGGGWQPLVQLGRDVEIVS